MLCSHRAFFGKRGGGEYISLSLALSSLSLFNPFTQIFAKKKEYRYHDIDIII